MATAVLERTTKKRSMKEMATKVEEFQTPPVEPTSGWNLDKNSKEYREYGYYLTHLCNTLENLQHDYLSVEERNILIKRASDMKTKLLKSKEALGFYDGLAFLEDNKFDGFEIKNGRLIETQLGGFNNIRKITHEWVVNPDSNYKYEVAALINMLRYPFNELESIETTSAPTVAISNKVEEVRKGGNIWNKIKTSCMKSFA